MHTLTKPSRILLKLSGEMLAGDKKYGIEVERLDCLAKKIVKLQKKGIEIVIVIGGGNIFRGIKGAAEGMERGTADYMGMLATIMNGLALGDAIEKNGSEVRIMSAMEISRVSEVFIRRRAIKHLKRKRIILCVAGTGNPYFTTDSAAVLRALELNCEYMVKGTKVDGVYDKDPMKHKDAKKYDNISIDEALKLGLRIMDQSAIALAKDENLSIFVTKISDIDKIGTSTISGSMIFANDRV